MAASSPKITKADPTLLAKLKEIETYLEKRKTEAGARWDTCTDLQNRLNDFASILNYFQTQAHHFFRGEGHYPAKKLPDPSSRITKGWGSYFGMGTGDRYLRLRGELERLITDLDDRAVFNTFDHYIRDKTRDYNSDLSIKGTEATIGKIIATQIEFNETYLGPQKERARQREEPGTLHVYTNVHSGLASFSAPAPSDGVTAPAPITPNYF